MRNTVLVNKANFLLQRGITNSRVLVKYFHLRCLIEDLFNVYSHIKPAFAKTRQKQTGFSRNILVPYPKEFPPYFFPIPVKISLSST